MCPELDFRCIDPTEYCCDPHVSPDTCKFMYPCCESVIEFSIRSRYIVSVSRVSLSEDLIIAGIINPELGPVQESLRGEAPPLTWSRFTPPPMLSLGSVSWLS